MDQVADGYFWMNSKEEILLLTQKKMMQDYWLWTASRPFFQKSETNEAPKTTEECETTQEEASRETFLKIHQNRCMIAQKKNCSAAYKQNSSEIFFNAISNC